MCLKRIAAFVIVVSVICLLVNQGNAWRRRRRRRCPPTNCQMSQWSSWSTCSAVACGSSGSQYRTRHVLSNPSCGGTACPPNIRETTNCDGTTPVNCVYSPWSTWSACPPSQCEDTQTSRRYIVSKEQCRGTPCNMTALRKTRPCNQTFCVNQGNLSNGRCSCPPDYHGSCCQYSSK